MSDPAELVHSLRHLRPQHHDITLLPLGLAGARTPLLHALTPTPAAFTTGRELRRSLPRGGGNFRGRRRGSIIDSSESGGGRGGGGGGRR